MLYRMIGLNNLRRHWVLTWIAVFSLSIAMSLGVTALSVSNTTLILRPAAPEPNRLVTIYNRSSDKSVEQISYPDYAFYRSANHVFSDVAAVPDQISLLFEENFAGRAVRALSANYFAVLGIRPYLGRLFEAPNDEANARAVVMTYSFWHRLGADPKVIGRKFGQYTIIGVTPEKFTGSLFGLNGDLLTPLAPSFDAG